MSRVAIVAFIFMGIALPDKQVFGEPIPSASAQWKQSIERPTRGWDYDGKRILGHVGYDICLWDAETGKLLHRLKVHQERIQKVQFSPDRVHALSSSWTKPGPMTNLKSRDTRTVLWNLSTGKSLHMLPGQVAGEFSSDGTRIFTFSQRPEKSSSFDASVWDALTGRELVKVTLDDGSGPYWDALHFPPDGRHLVHLQSGANLLHGSSVAVLYNASDGRELARVAAKNGISRYTSNGALACFDSEAAYSIDIESGRPLHRVTHEVKDVWSGAWTHDGRKVAAVPRRGPIQIWDIESGTMIAGAQRGNRPVYPVIVSPDNSRLAIGWGHGQSKIKKLTGSSVCTTRALVQKSPSMDSPQKEK